MIPDSEGRAPLHWAVDRGHLGITKLLLNRNADVNAKVHLIFKIAEVHMILHDLFGSCLVLWFVIYALWGLYFVAWFVSFEILWVITLLDVAVIFLYIHPLLFIFILLTPLNMVFLVICHYIGTKRETKNNIYARFAERWKKTNVLNALLNLVSLKLHYWPCNHRARWWRPILCQNRWWF